MMCNPSSSSREALLREIDKVSFAVDDILLYLDTHPCDEKALDYYKEHVARRRQLMQEYAQAYGPLTIDDGEASCEQSWKWAQQPFPWEQKGGCR